MVESLVKGVAETPKEDEKELLQKARDLILILERRQNIA